MDIHEFDEIRPYEKGEMKDALNQLLNDRHFNKMMQGFAPWLPKALRNGIFRMMFIGVKTPLDFQLRFMKHVVSYVLKKHARGYSFKYDSISNRGNYLFVSNHRDIVLDSAILDLMLHEADFSTTCEIAIGDNLLIYPWIKTLVRMNKAFTVRRSLKAKEMMESSILMSRYMHYSITQKKENIWIAQREGRAKDSSDQTQESVLKMLALGGEGTIVERLKELNIVPLTLSYEYDPCDYLKAAEFQLKRDNADYKKSKNDDLLSMQTDITGYKGRIHYAFTPCINSKLDEIAQNCTNKKEQAAAVCAVIDAQIHSAYQLYAINRWAYEQLTGDTQYATVDGADESAMAEKYLRGQLTKINIPNKDEEYLWHKLLEMYANPFINYLKTNTNN